MGQKQMTARQRILEALSCRQPDRVPISTYELCGFNSKAFENSDPSYKHLMDIIREKSDAICMWNPESDAVFLQSSYPAEIECREQRQGDTVVIKRTLQTPKGPLHQTTKEVDNIHTIWQVEHWCKSTDDVDRALSVPYEPRQFDFTDYGRIKEENNNKGIIMSSLSDPLCIAAELMEFGEFTIWAVTETDHFIKTLDQIHERNMESLKNMLEKQVVDLYRICGPEYATPPFLPPRCFKQFVVPYVKDMVNLIHEKGGMARLHCHGRIAQVLDMILETGADSIDPCEPPPDGDIPLAEVKKNLQGRMSICGNIELKVLETSKREQVAQTVKDCMQAAKAGGGYIIMPTAAPINTPLAKQTEENYINFIETALEHGNY
jgi:uroporphyrinogen-III decarboxylase